MPTRDEMIAWLKSFRSHLYLKTKDSEMFVSILAALSGPSEEERTRMLQYFNTMNEIVQKHSPVGKALKKLGVRIPTAMTDQIRALILGHAVQEGEKEEKKL